MLLSLRFSQRIAPCYSSALLPCVLSCNCIRFYSQALPNHNKATSESNTLVYSLSNYQSSFPQDKQLNKDIAALKHLIVNRHEPHAFNVAILYESPEVRRSSKIMEVLLADPLASNNRVWFERIRRRHGLARFFFGEYTKDLIDEDDVEYQIPSPVLSGLYRNTFHQETPEVPNDLIIEEFENAIQLESSASDCTYVIYVTQQFKYVTTELPASIKDRLLLQVIDNTEYSPSSSESSPLSIEDGIQTHLIKINSNLAYSGIAQFIERDVHAADEYIDSMTKSNVYELFKFVDYFSRTESLTSWYLSKVIDSVSSKIKIANTAINEGSDVVKSDIDQFGQMVNAELQYEFIPETTNFVQKKLSWWKLYYKNDNVEYDLKDFFNKHFMNKGIENYNFLRGKILLNDEVVKNPLFDLKDEVINKRLNSEVQLQVYSILSKAFIYYQLPISVIAAFAYQFFDFSGNACIALFSLGWILGFNQVSRDWINFMNKWMNQLFEEVRITIGSKCIDDGLMRESNDQLIKINTENNMRQKILYEIEKSSRSE
ncbi:hypothetical protein CORT_0A12500 [Candida orthopsilosis Co 90-125]|uniref:Mmc1 C-terminal domain-containing protein n=1 Tax=Candida orthopsilosis (strain 90-125) TaxID=1136231 RepID=H8WZ03_CANO9|nr:hypothetical protein CORT_0A12500 [Candida orthopsilosis Co 90-125]CCG21635.1 hypothetical protein CORT_0A12500 [Candida orthopsilosis Co 90-125]